MRVLVIGAQSSRQFQGSLCEHPHHANCLHCSMLRTPASVGCLPGHHTRSTPSAFNSGAASGLHSGRQRRSLMTRAKDWSNDWGASSSSSGSSDSKGSSSSDKSAAEPHAHSSDSSNDQAAALGSIADGVQATGGASDLPADKQADGGSGESRPEADNVSNYNAGSADSGATSSGSASSGGAAGMGGAAQAVRPLNVLSTERILQAKCLLKALTVCSVRNTDCACNPTLQQPPSAANLTLVNSIPDVSAPSLFVQRALPRNLPGVEYTFLLAGFLKIMTIGAVATSTPTDVVRTAAGKYSVYLMVPVGLLMAWIARQITSMGLHERKRYAGFRRCIYQFITAGDMSNCYRLGNGLTWQYYAFTSSPASSPF